MRALNGMIVMNRGDTEEFCITITDEAYEDELYRMCGNDALYFGLMDPGQPFEVALLRKKFTAEDQDKDGQIHIEIKPEDTLDLLPGKYFYSIKLHADHEADECIICKEPYKMNKVVTVVKKTKFVICD